MSRLRWTRNFERGAAMVELAVLMLVFVPLVMLPMYFQDAMRYKLAVQEAVYSAAWDMAYANYQEDSEGTITGEAENDNHDLYADLRSDIERDASDEWIGGPWAKFKWRQQIDCQIDTSLASSVSASSMWLALALLNSTGGKAYCKGSIDVRNDYVPKVFMQEFAEKDLFEQDNDPFEFGEGSDHDFRFGLLVDPWCIQEEGRSLGFLGYMYFTLSSIPMDGYALRVAAVLLAAPGRSDFTDAWDEFANKMNDEDVSESKSSLEMNLDNPTWPDVKSNHLPDNKNLVPHLGVQWKYYTTPMEDGHDDTYKETFDAREADGDEAYYLGCKQFEPNCS